LELLAEGEKLKKVNVSVIPEDSAYKTTLAEAREINCLLKFKECLTKQTSL